MGRFRKAATAAFVTTLAFTSGGALGQGRAKRADPKPPSCAATPEADRILAVDSRGEFRLASGRSVRLADIRLPEPHSDAPGRASSGRPDAAAWLRSLGGRDARVRLVSTADRWGLSAATIALTDGHSTIDIAELLVAEGLAIVDAGERDDLCRPDLLAREATARARPLGIWSDPGRVLAAAEPERLKAAAGRFAIVEGRVVSVGERRQRTYLNFGRDFARDFAIVLPKRTWEEMARAGVSASLLRGRTVRVRGILEARRGPVMEITAGDMIEWRDGAPSRP